MIALRDHQAYLADDLSLAAAAVRMHRVDDICLAVPWSRHEVIEVGSGDIHEHAGRDPSRRRPAVGTARTGALLAARRDFGAAHHTSHGSPISQRFEKRLFDLGLALCGLIALSPFLSRHRARDPAGEPGPALFRQTRYGFNQEPFRIFKFRTMRTMEDGAKVVAAKRGDARVTRLGAYLRRFSIDEIPATSQRPERRNVDRRPASARDGARPALCRPAVPLRAPPQRQARHHRLGAGARPPRRNHQRPGDARPGSSTTSTMSTTGRCGSTSRSCS